MAINPVLMALLYATFLSVPLTKVGQALRDGRFLAGLTVLNFLIVPVVVYLLSRSWSTCCPGSWPMTRPCC